MGTSRFICYNGDYLHAEKPFLGLNNSAFRFGDAITEDIHAYAAEPQFLNAHIEKLLSAMKLLSMKIPPHFKPEVFKLHISKLLSKNRIYGGAVIRLTVFSNQADFFIPGQHDVSFVLESRKLDHHFYELNSRGCVIDIFQEVNRHVDEFSSIRRAGIFLFLKAGLYCESKGLDDCIILNERKKITESVYSNVFLVKGRSVFTPDIHEGCVPGVLRSVMVDICNKSGFQTNDRCSLSPEALEEADEIFLTDAVRGIRWVGAYRQKRYYKKAIQSLLKMLNIYAFAGWNGSA